MIAKLSHAFALKVLGSVIWQQHLARNPDACCRSAGGVGCGKWLPIELASESGMRVGELVLETAYFDLVHPVLIVLGELIDVVLDEGAGLRSGTHEYRMGLR